MSGWWVVVDPRTPAERDASEDRMGPLVASWEASVMNMRFLGRLVNEGRAEQHSFHGYPNRFTVPAGVLVPLIIDGPPVEEWGQNTGQNYNVTLHRDKLLALPADHVLTVDVWDQT